MLDEAVMCASIDDQAVRPAPRHLELTPFDGMSGCDVRPHMAVVDHEVAEASTDVRQVEVSL